MPDRYPEGILFAESVADVQAGILLARERGLRVGVRSGGHSWGAWGLRDGALLLDLSRMTELSLDGETAIVGPGVRGGLQLAPFLLEHGRAFPGGHCPRVGVSGYLLQGGQGWNGRKWGWGCENVLELDVVTADGELHHVSETENSDLLWAARGAGPGYFAVVVRWYLRTFEAPRFPAQANYVFTLDRLPEVLAWTHEALAAAGPELEPVVAAAGGASLPFFEPGQAPDGHVLIMHATAMVDSEAEAIAAFAPLERGAVLEHALYRESAVPTVMEEEYAVQAIMNPEGHRYAADCIWTDAPAAELAPRLQPLFEGLPTEKAFAIWYGWNPPRVRRDMAFSVEANVYIAAYVVWEDPADDERCTTWLTDAMRKLEPVGAGAYTGDTDFIRRPERFLSEAAFARLETIRAVRDPDGLFVGYPS
jgi:FAD/FMN-containing dehydrogenase